MKCPKCGYLGFEHVDRCRNCGYDFALAPMSDDLPELQLRGDTQPSPLDDLALLDRGVAVPPRAQRVRDRPAAPSSDLPLFGGNDLEPLITKLAPPRPPLAVRRATPEVPRLRSEPRSHAPELDLELPALLPAVDASRPSHAAEWPATIDAREAASDAPLGARFIAMVLDIVLLAAVDAVVIYLTMQICRITIWE